MVEILSDAQQSLLLQSSVAATVHNQTDTYYHLSNEHFLEFPQQIVDNYSYLLLLQHQVMQLLHGTDPLLSANLVTIIGR